MRSQQPKLKTQLFSCGFFRHCAQTVLSPTNATTPQYSPTFPHTSTTDPPPLPAPQLPLQSDPPPRVPSKLECESSSSSSSSSATTSQSFTQWKFPLSTSTTSTVTITGPPPQIQHALTDPIPCPNLQELFHLAELQLSSGLDTDRFSAFQLLERSLVPNPPSEDPPCPPALMRGIVCNLKNPTGVKSATKILFALCLAEVNRRVAVEAGAVAAVIESGPELDGPPAERALAALELMCMVPEGAAEVRDHALAVPVMVTMMGRMAARGKEYAIGVLAVIYNGALGYHVAAPPEEVARAVSLALQSECSVRGRRKGAQLLKTLQDYGRPAMAEEGK